MEWSDLQLDEALLDSARERQHESTCSCAQTLSLRYVRTGPQMATARVSLPPGGNLQHLLTRAKLAALDLPCPTRRPTGWRPPENHLAWVNFHTFRHTWATWMRRYGGLDAKGSSQLATA